MPSVFYCGKLPWHMKPVLFLNGLLIWILGNIKDTVAMKERVRKGYDGEVTDDIRRYDLFGQKHYMKIAHDLITDVELEGKDILEVGCGTGILSMLLMERGANRLVGGDISRAMLEQCREKAADQGYDQDRMEFKEMDSEKLPFGDCSFDIVFSSMMLELVPNQEQVVAEMTRVVKPGGMIVLSTHGPEHYYDLIEAALNSMRIRDFLRFLGYRFEVWQSTEAELQRIMHCAGLTDIQTRRIEWREDFQNGGQAHDFFLSTSSAYWYERFSVQERIALAERSRRYFERKQVISSAMDVTLGCGRRPG
jgi:ubiquinone/menaquinone biosynthesis C-methylase UbiE